MMNGWIEEKKRDLAAGQAVREKYVTEQFPKIQKEADEATKVAQQFGQDPDIIHQLNQKLDGMSDSLDELETITQAKAILIPAMRRIRDIGALVVVISGAVALLYGLEYDILASVSSAVLVLVVEFVLMMILFIVTTSASHYRRVLRLLNEEKLWRTE